MNWGLMEWPTREQIYAEVDEMFRREHPMALPLTRDGKDDEPLRREWLSMRDWVLNEHVNRVYWEMYPDAPVKIDPDNPAHDQYERGWIEIRDRIMSLAPQPPINDGEIDLSHVRSSALEHLEIVLYQIRPELHSDLRATIETFVMRYAEHVQDGGNDSWESDVVEIPSNEDPEHKVRLQLFAVHYEDYYQGGLKVLEVSKPLPYEP